MNNLNILEPIKKYHRPNANIYLYRGEELTLSELARVTGTNKETIRGRLLRGLSVESAVINERFPRTPKKVNTAFTKPHNPKPIVQSKAKPKLVIDDDNFEINDVWIEQSSDEKKELMRAKKQRENDAYEARVLKESAGREYYEIGN